MMNQFPDQIHGRATVKLKFRNNRTRERSEELVEVPAPETDNGQASQLAELVQQRWPGAELRVFHDGAASFTRDELHVVAVYVAGAPADSRGPRTDRAPGDAVIPGDLPLTG